ncbi:MAG TPA: hypothetical protein VLJ37_04595 [bacterium]|nr:hypothetical protein [bacterium]
MLGGLFSGCNYSKSYFRIDPATGKKVKAAGPITAEELGPSSEVSKIPAGAPANATDNPQDTGTVPEVIEPSGGPGPNVPGTPTGNVPAPGTGGAGTGGTTGTAAGTGTTGSAPGTAETAPGGGSAGTGTGAAGTGSAAPESAPAAAAVEEPRLANCYVFVFASAKSGADNVYFKSNCAAFGESKISNNTDANVRYGNLSIRDDQLFMTADATRATPFGFSPPGAQIWDLRQWNDIRLLDLNMDVNFDGTPDLRYPASVSWGEGHVVFIAREIATNRSVVRIQIAPPSTIRETVYYRLVTSGAGNQFQKILWHPVKFSNDGFDMIIATAKRPGDAQFRLYAIDIDKGPTDDWNEILPGALPGVQPAQVKPSVSPGGRSIAFVRYHNAAGDVSNPHVWIADLASSPGFEERLEGPKLTGRIHGSAARDLGPGDSPCLTHDGKYVIFEKDAKFFATEIERNLTFELRFLEADQAHDLACAPSGPQFRAVPDIRAVAPLAPETTVYRAAGTIEVVMPAGGGSTGGTTSGTGGTTGP